MVEEIRKIVWLNVGLWKQFEVKDAIFGGRKLLPYTHNHDPEDQSIPNQWTVSCKYRWNFGGGSRKGKLLSKREKIWQRGIFSKFLDEWAKKKLNKFEHFLSFPPFEWCFGFTPVKYFINLLSTGMKIPQVAREFSTNIPETNK